MFYLKLQHLDVSSFKNGYDPLVFIYIAVCIWRVVTIQLTYPVQEACGFMCPSGRFTVSVKLEHGCTSVVSEATKTKHYAARM